MTVTCRNKIGSQKSTNYQLACSGGGKKHIKASVPEGMDVEIRITTTYSCHGDERAIAYPTREDMADLLKMMRIEHVPGTAAPVLTDDDDGDEEEAKEGRSIWLVDLRAYLY